MRVALSLCCALLLASSLCYARSALSPKHSGLDAPGHAKTLPMPSYTDAYGNGLTDKMPEERKPRHRPRPGAYGGALAPADPSANTLPLSPREKGKPLWGF